MLQADIKIFEYYFPHRFSVQYSGAPTPVITWYREGFEIQTSRDFQIMTTATRSTLYIPEVFPEDTGMFTVKIQNQYGMAQCKAMLEVQGKRHMNHPCKTKLYFTLLLRSFLAVRYSGLILHNFFQITIDRYLNYTFVLYSKYSKKEMNSPFNFYESV